MTKIILLNSNTNTTRLVDAEEEVRLAPGEKAIGSTGQEEEQNELIKVAEQAGIPFGDLVARATKAFGIQPCSACEKRRTILNQIQKLGVAETVRRLRGTF